MGLGPGHLQVLYLELFLLILLSLQKILISMMMFYIMSTFRRSCIFTDGC